MMCLQVDGETSAAYADKSCTHTQRGVGQWWKLDLQRVYTIDHVDVWNRRAPYAGRLNGVQVSVDGAVCSTVENAQRGRNAVQCNGKSGR